MPVPASPIRTTRAPRPASASSSACSETAHVALASHQRGLPRGRGLGDRPVGRHWPSRLARELAGLSGSGRPLAALAQDLVIERLRLRLGLRPKLPLERRHADLVLAERSAPPSRIDVELHQISVHGLLERIDLERAERGLHGGVDRRRWRADGRAVRPSRSAPPRAAARGGRATSPRTAPPAPPDRQGSRPGTARPPGERPGRGLGGPHARNRGRRRPPRPDRGLTDSRSTTKGAGWPRRGSSGARTASGGGSCGRWSRPRCPREGSPSLSRGMGRAGGQGQVRQEGLRLACGEGQGADRVETCPKPPRNVRFSRAIAVSFPLGSRYHAPSERSHRATDATFTLSRDELLTGIPVQRERVGRHRAHPACATPERERRGCRPTESQAAVGVAVRPDRRRRIDALIDYFGERPGPDGPGPADDARDAARPRASARGTAGCD